jgi:hypothetical protein
MNGSSTATAIAPSGPAERTRWRGSSGERLAVGTVALAVAMIPLLRPSGPGNTSPLVDGAIVLAVGATLLWAGASGAKLHVPYGLAIAVLIASGALAGLLGAYPEVGLLALTQDIFLLVWVTALVNVARTPAALKTVLRIWVVSTIFWAGLLDVLILTGQSHLAGVTGRWGGRASLTFGDPNMAATYYFLSLMVIGATKFPRNRLLRVGAYVLHVMALLYTGSNGGMVVLLIGTLAASLLLLRRRAGLVPALAASALLIVVGVGLYSQVKLDDIRSAALQTGQQLLIDSVGRSDESAAFRELLLTESAGLYLDGAPLGLGPNATEAALTERQSHFRKNTHNDYVAALIERGIPGAVGLLLLIGAVAVRTWTVAKGPLSVAFAAAVPRPEFFVGAVLGIGVAASFYQVLHFRHVWALLGVIAALYLWGREPPKGLVA